MSTVTLDTPRQLTPERLRHLFEPRSVALVGASDRSSWSHLIHTALTVGGFTGDVHYVNPRSPTANGRPTVARLGDLEAPVDLAYVMVPQSGVLEVLEEAADAGITNAIVLSAGFAEAGPDGQRAQREMEELATRHGLAIVGPNTLGFVNVPRRVSLFPGAHNWSIQPGSVGLASQSGALGGTLMGYFAAEHIGLSLLVSTGNEAVVTLSDVVDYLIDEENTRAIALFIEAIRKPAELLRVAERALGAGKPIVALKVGRSELSARTAAAHTGAMVGDDRVIDAVFRQSGIIRVNSLEQLVVTAAVLAQTGPLRGRRLGVASISGGACDIIADRAEQEAIQLPGFAERTVAGLAELMPDYGTAHNPLDVTGAAIRDPNLFGQTLELIGADGGIDVLLCQMGVTLEQEPGVLTESLVNIAAALRAAPVPRVFSPATGEGLPPEHRDLVTKLGLPFVGGGLELVLSGLGRAMWWSDFYRQRRNEPRTVFSPELTSAPPAEERKGHWSEERARRLLEANGVPVVPAILATDADGAANAAAQLGYPVVLKVASPDLLHKSDIGGVRLDVRDEPSVRAAFDDILAAARRVSPPPRIEGVLVSPMRSGGVELLTGIVRDPMWGQVLAVGLGGVWTEIFNDVSLRVLPVTAADVQAMLGELKGAALLRGARGSTAADVGALVDVILRIARLAQALPPDLESLEINPLRVQGSQIEALDALVTWNAPSPHPSAAAPEHAAH